MSEQIIEVEADSLDEAREQVQTQIPEGLYLLAEQVISDGELKTETVRTLEIEADSEEEAKKQVESQVIAGLHILSARVISDGSIKKYKLLDNTFAKNEGM